MTAQKWAETLKVLAITAVIATIGNFIATAKAGKPVPPLEAVPGMLVLFAIVVLGLGLQQLAEKAHIKLPGILFISLVGIVLSVPGLLPFAPFVSASVKKISLLALCTPILAYAGIAIGKDLDEFKKQGVAIIVVACLTFFGTYIGSAIIAQVLLKLTHII